MRKFKPFSIGVPAGLFIGFIFICFFEIVIAEPLGIELLARTSDGPGGRMKGDIISMKISPASWGKGEGPPNYVIVKIDNLSVKDFSQYHIRHGKLYSSDTSEFPETVRSRFRFDLDNLPTAVSGMVTVQKTEAEENLIDRRIEIISIR